MNKIIPTRTSRFTWPTFPSLLESVDSILKFSVIKKDRVVALEGEPNELLDEQTNSRKEREREREREKRRDREKEGRKGDIKTGSKSSILINVVVDVRFAAVPRGNIPLLCEKKSGDPNGQKFLQPRRSARKIKFTPVVARPSRSCSTFNEFRGCSSYTAVAIS